MAVNNGLDLNLVRVFITAYETGSVVGAAQRLNLTQPAVSNALKRLNNHLGYQLFVRDGRGIRPSDGAIRLYQRINPPFSTIIDAFEGFRDFVPTGSRRRFTVGMDGYLEIYLARICNAIEKEAPGITLETRLNRDDPDLKNLRLDREDLVLTATDRFGKHVNCVTLFRDGIALVGRRGHPKRRSIQRNTIKSMPTLQFACIADGFEHHTPETRLLKQMGCNVQLLTSSISSLLNIIAQTNHVALLPSSFFENGSDLSNHFFSIPLDLPPVEVKMYWCKRKDDDSGNIWLRTLIQNEISEGSRQPPSISLLLGRPRTGDQILSELANSNAYSKRDGFSSAQYHQETGHKDKRQA